MLTASHSWKSSMQSTGANWEDLRKEARLLENQIDLKLIELSKLGTSLKSPLASSNGYDDPAKKPLLSVMKKIHQVLLSYLLTKSINFYQI